MSADLPPPSLDELLAILSSSPELSASPWSTEQMTLNFTFKRPNLVAGSKYVFEYPSKILPEIKRQLELLRQLKEIAGFMEGAYRLGDPKKSIEDAIAFMEQELNQDVHGLGSLYTKMRREHFGAAVKYLRELDRRRRDADARMEAIRRQHEAREKAEMEETRRREEEARRKEAEYRAQQEKHERWEREEEQRRHHRQQQTSDSGYDRGSAQERVWEAFRAAGGFDNLRGANHETFEELYRRTQEELRRRGEREHKRRRPFEDFFGADPGWGPGYGRQQNNTPPPSSAKRRWFDILGCPAGANADQIRRAARNAAKGLHPDKNKDPKAAERFKEISEAKAEGLGGL